jgi:hypothetical protein
MRTPPADVLIGGMGRPGRLCSRHWTVFLRLDHILASVHVGTYKSVSRLGPRVPAIHRPILSRVLSASNRIEAIRPTVGQVGVNHLFTI